MQIQFGHRPAGAQAEAPEDPDSNSLSMMFAILGKSIKIPFVWLNNWNAVRSQLHSWKQIMKKDAGQLLDLSAK